MKNNRRRCFWVFTFFMLMSGGCSKKLENPEIKKVNFQAADHGKMIPELSDLIRARLKGIRMKGLLICNNSEDKDGTGIEKSVGETETNIYNEIMNQYIDAVDRIFPPAEKRRSGEGGIWSLAGEVANSYLFINAFLFDELKVYYTLYDVDGNGTPELFIGGSPWGSDEPNMIYDFYRLSSDGYSVYPVESVSVKVSYDLIVRFYHDAESEDEISEKEHRAIFQKYIDVGEADLNWSEIVKE